MSRQRVSGLQFPRHFSKQKTHPFDQITWDKRRAEIRNDKGEVIFGQDGVEVPKFWSQTATNIVAVQYFYGQVETPGREYSVKQLIRRVVNTITRWGVKGGYFASRNDAKVFKEDLTYLILHQYFAFNSPVWYNVGIEDVPRTGACFIIGVEDTMESILDLAKTEGMIFKWGSGVGTNLSTLRSSAEGIGGGGVSSGPMPFLRGLDTMAGAIKSGGKTRRAARMSILSIDHPDVVQFIRCKAEEEQKAHILIQHGYDPSFNVLGGAYDSVSFQNSNHSVRVTDAFMQAVESDNDWHTKEVTTGKPAAKYKATELLHEIAQAAWVCGDPGLQYHDTINHWHTCPESGPINGSNPCSEYLFIDDSQCNLGSLNLMKFRIPDGGFDVDAFRCAVRLCVTAQEIVIDHSSYPTKNVEQNTHNFRTIGLGYANLGALLMSHGLPYDSNEGRAFAAGITAIMTGEAYLQSSVIASVLGPFSAYPLNKVKMLEVIHNHCSAIPRVVDKELVPHLRTAADKVWELATASGRKWGYRNAQVTLLAPTGTIGFMMDCATTGVEPDIALVKHKKLVGGGQLKLVNDTVPLALKFLGYPGQDIESICKYTNECGTVEGAPNFKPEHLQVFDCALPTRDRVIHYSGHVKMMAVVQPFLSGAISKTVNLPNRTTTDEIVKLYVEAWKAGLKCLAVYRDGCKQSQPVSTTKTPINGNGHVSRHRLPDERQSITHKFSIGGHEGYFTVGLFENRQPGELFIVMAKSGSTMSGLTDGFATAVSIALQYGVPLRVLVDKFSHSRFEPDGMTTNPEIPIAKSINDYIFRWMGKKFLNQNETLPEVSPVAEGGYGVITDLSLVVTPTEFRPCANCGALMSRNGSCYKCGSCGETSGCS